MLGITINCGSVSIVPQPSVAKRLIEAAYRSGLSALRGNAHNDCAKVKSQR
jgi:hypothetical protein